MRVVGNDPIRLRSDGAVGEFVVVGIGGDDMEMEVRIGVSHRIVKFSHAIEDHGKSLPSLRFEFAREHFFVFEQDFV